MKKTISLAFAALALATTAAHAGDLTKDIAISGSVHGASEYNFRGTDFSAQEPSIGLKLKATHATGVYAVASIDTIKINDLRTGQASLGQGQLHNTLGVGYNHHLSPDLIVGVGLKHNLFTGKGHVGDLSFTELFATAYWNGFSAKLGTNVSGADLPVAGLNKGDVFGELGYTHKIGKFNVGGDVGYNIFGDDSVGAKDGVAYTQLRAGYSFNDNFHVNVTHQFGDGKDGFYKNTGNNRTWVKASYQF